MKSDVVRYSKVKSQSIALSAQYLRLFLAEIDDFSELKLTIFCFWALQQKEGNYRYLRYAEILDADDMLQGLRLIARKSDASELLNGAIDRAIGRGTLLEARIELDGKTQRLFVMNDEPGQMIHRQILAGEWIPSGDDEIEILPVRPTLFGLYEENIGVLTPMIVDSIKDAESSYPYEWINDAIKYAVERNARNWTYIRKVLESWQREGRSREKPGQHLERHKRYTTGKWKDFIES